MSELKLIECPRDAMQGLHEFIPTETKISYINSLLACGFDTIDCGSFVSPRAMPQMKDSRKVLNGLDKSDSKLLCIIPNERGAKDAAEFEQIDYFGYPFSISEQFQKRNLNSTIDQSLVRVEKIHEIAKKHDKEMVVYLSMGFGNPYGEEWHPDILARWSERLYKDLEITIQAASDTIGSATAEIVRSVFETLIPSLPEVEFGAHLHTVPENAKNLIQAAYEGGCRRFDGAIKGFGGCPMAKDDLTGNMPTEKMLEWFNEHNIKTGVNEEAFNIALNKALQVFP
jgi:hydroxymethylglutaryl-CoA lyase